MGRVDKKLSEEEILNRFKDRPYLSIDYSTYKNCQTKCKFIDKDFGEFWKSLEHVERTFGHPKRRKENYKSAESIKNRVEIIQKDLDDKIAFKKLKLIPESFTDIKAFADFIDLDYGKCRLLVSGVLYGASMHKARKNENRIRQSLKIFKEKLSNMYGDLITVIDSTYTGIGYRATFVDKDFGQWKTTPYEVLKGKTGHKRGCQKKKRTSLARFGTEFPVQNKKVSDKLARSLQNKVILKHWKTNEDIICTSSFEHAVISKLNETKRDYVWQIHFKLEELNKVYICDLFLVEDNKYIEIKGRFINEINKQKWETFNKLHPNSELWQMRDVTKFVGISYYRMKLNFKKLYNEQKIQQALVANLNSQ